MFYTLSKIGWFLITPSNALVVLIAIGTALMAFRFQRVGLVLSTAGLAGLLLCGLGPVGSWLVAPLEYRFPKMVDDPSREPFGIIVLGGGIEDRLSALPGHALELNEAGDRIMALIELALRHPDKPIVFSGGGGRLMGASEIGEADAVRKHLERYGIAPGRLTYETRSRTTAENAQFSADLLKPQAGQSWWLVTSAFHMPRAVGTFRKAGFQIAAYPVDFRTAGKADSLRTFAAISEGLRRTDLAFREWLGLAAYRLTGRTDALFPSP